MYKYSDKMIFNEDEGYIKSLALRSHKKVKCVCPFCNKERLLGFDGVNKHNSTACAGCVKTDRIFNEMLGKRFGRLTVITEDSIALGKSKLLCRCDCGKEVIMPIHNIRSGHTQSCGCLQKETASALCGPLHPSYDHSITEEQRELSLKKRRNPEAKRFRRAVKARDGNTCTICDSKNQLVVHHLNGFKDNVALRYDVDNGVTLCWSCHNAFHQNFMGGYNISCTEQDFEAFLYQI